MGNAIAKKCDVPKAATGSAGHCSLWELRNGKNRENNEDITLWTFDKADLGKKKTPVTDKAVIEQIFQIMKKDMSVMKECGMCPSSIVQVKEIIEDGKTALVFTTEPVICSLADLLSQFFEIPNGRQLHAHHFEIGNTLSELEMSRGILNITEGLQYFHTVQRKLHLNLCPESIVITQDGHWKLCGFGLALSFQQGSDNLRLASPYFLKPCTTTAVLPRLEPDVRYSAPELTTGGYSNSNVRYLTPTSDIFSLGMLAYEVYQFNLKGSVSMDAPMRTHIPTLNIQGNNALLHETAVRNTIPVLDFSFVNQGVSSFIRGMIQPDTTSRYSAVDIMNHQYFITGSLAVLKSIDTLQTRDIGTQSSILLGLPSQLGPFPARILQTAILPAICKLCAANSALWLYVFPVHTYISTKLPALTYQKIAGPSIAQGLAITNPAETMLTFLKNISFIQSTFDSNFFYQHVLQLFSNCLDKQHMGVQTSCLQILCDETVHKAIDQNGLTDKIVPKACKEACKNPEPAVKAVALYFISLISHRLDRHYILSNILPSLKYIKEKESDPVVSMCVVGNYESAAESVGAEYIATQILPTIQPLLIDRSLNKQQFELTVSLVRRMLMKVITLRTSELGMPPINMGQDPVSMSETMIDPFAGAKAILLNNKKVIETPATYSINTPKVPVNMPPPPPSMPAPQLPVNLNPVPSASSGTFLSTAAIATSSNAYSSSSSKSVPIIAPPPTVTSSSSNIDIFAGLTKASTSTSGSSYGTTNNTSSNATTSMSASAYGTTNNTSSYHSTYTPPMQQPMQPAASSSLEAQIKQTQEQIAKLSSSLGSSSSGGGTYGYTPPHMPPMQYQQQPVYSNMTSSQPAYSGMGYSAYSQSSGVQNFAELNNNGGYRPPTVSVPVMQQTNNVMKPSVKDDPFDFLNS